VLVSLAMTACATFIPTKVKAATLTGLPAGEIPRRPGESVEFTFVLTPALNSTVTVTGGIFQVDNSELSPLTALRFVGLNNPITTTTTIARGTYKVGTPVKDGISDASIRQLLYEEKSSSGTVTNPPLSANAGDVVPVPEPLTMFGTAIGLGGGVLFKRKSSKKIVS
jgi:hypothetical protein